MQKFFRIPPPRPRWVLAPLDIELPPRRAARDAPVGRWEPASLHSANCTPKTKCWLKK